jgi:PAS domain S-box-containing protein
MGLGMLGIETVQWVGQAEALWGGLRVTPPNERERSMLKFLLVDHHQTECEAVRDLLCAHWFECQAHIATSRDEAQSLLASESYDVVIGETDVSGLEGIALLEVVQGRAPVIFYTSRGSETLAVQALKSGAADYVVKSAQNLPLLPEHIRIALLEKRASTNERPAWHSRASSQLYLVLREAEQLLSAPDLDIVLRRAVEFLHHEIGLERCGLFLVDDTQGEMLSGTYGTNLSGEITDEHGAQVNLVDGSEWLRAVQRAHAENRPWVVQENIPFYEWDGRQAISLERSGWVICTPMFSHNQLIGVVFNDTARSGAAIDVVQQELTAIFCPLIGHIIERKRVEDKLRQSEELLRALFANFPNGAVHVFDRDLRYVLAEGQSLVRAGIDPAQLVGKTVSEVYGPEVLELVAEPYRRAFAGEEVTFENSNMGRDFSINAVPVRDSTGKINTIMAVAIDVTETKRLLLDQQRFEALIQNSDDFIGITNLNGDFVFVNRAGRQLIGLPDEAEVLAANVWECATGTAAEMMRQAGRTALEIRGRWEGESTWTHRQSGEAIDVYSKVFTLRDSHSGEAVGLATVTQDLRLRRRIEQQLHDNEARFRRLTRANIIGVLVVDLAGPILEANDYFLHCLGYTSDDLAGGLLNWRDMTSPETLDISERAIAQMRESAMSPPYEKEFLHKNGQRVPVLVGATLLEGSKDRCLAFVLDLTTRKELEQELRTYAHRLEQSNRELQDFAYVASHDLQEPLRKIEAFGERLMEDFEGSLDETGRDYLERMQNASRRMRTLISDLLSLSRIATQGRPFTRVDLNQIAEEVLSDLEIPIRESHAQIEVQKLPTLEADALQMRQLLQNLLGNALKFRRAEAAPQIRIWSEGPDAEGCHALRVQDNGIGFEQEYAARIFAPFTRLHGRSQYEGTGIGLAICRRIVERHGGNITAQSTLGQGTTFTMLLPALHHSADEKSNSAMLDSTAIGEDLRTA